MFFINCFAAGQLHRGDCFNAWYPGFNRESIIAIAVMFYDPAIGRNQGYALMLVYSGIFASMFML